MGQKAEKFSDMLHYFGENFLAVPVGLVARFREAKNL